VIVYSLDNIRQRRGSFCLNIDRLRITQGQIYVLTGPNGCGKTSLLDLLAFLSLPSEGSLHFAGDRVVSDSPSALLALRRRIGYLMQDPYLFNTSVVKNIRYGLELQKCPTDAMERRVADIAEKLRLTHLLHCNAHRLSGGEAQRVAIARTLVLEPEVLLLDEPTANIDRARIQSVEQLIKQVQTERGTSVIMSTHSTDQARRMATRLLTMVEGRVIEAGHEHLFSRTRPLAGEGGRNGAGWNRESAAIGQVSDASQWTSSEGKLGGAP